MSQVPGVASGRATHLWVPASCGMAAFQSGLPAFLMKAGRVRWVSPLWDEFGRFRVGSSTSRFSEREEWRCLVGSIVSAPLPCGEPSVGSADTGCMYVSTSVVHPQLPQEQDMSPGDAPLGPMPCVVFLCRDCTRSVGFASFAKIGTQAAHGQRVPVPGSS